MGGNQYYQIFEDSYGRIANGAKDLGGMAPAMVTSAAAPSGGGGTLYDNASMYPTATSAQTANSNWNSYSGSELDFPSPAAIGGMATIATPASYASTREATNAAMLTNTSYPSQQDYYLSQSQIDPSYTGTMAPSPNTLDNPNWHMGGGTAGFGDVKPELNDAMGDGVSTTTNFYNSNGFGSSGMVSPMASSTSAAAAQPALSTSPSLSLHSDFGDDTDSKGKRKGGRPTSTTPGVGRGKRKKTSDPDTANPQVKALKDKERRHSNNTRERIRIRDINDALCELGRVCRSLKPKIQGGTDDKPQTKLSILNTAVDVITMLEREVRERNLNTSALSLRQGVPGMSGQPPYQATSAYTPIAQSSPAQSRPSSSGSVKTTSAGIIAN